MLASAFCQFSNVRNVCFCVGVVTIVSHLLPKNLEKEPNSKFSTIFCFVSLQFSMEGSFIFVLIIISFRCSSSLDQVNYKLSFSVRVFGEKEIERFPLLSSLFLKINF